MYPKLIEIGRLFLPSYGFFVALGVFLALTVSKWRASKDGLDGNRVFDLGLSVVLAAFLGSKVALIFVYPGDFFRSFSSFINLLRSGGVFYGGFVAGVITAVVLFRRYRLPHWEVGDTIGAALPLGQAIGRIGCFMAGCCWGRECDLAWSVTFTNPAAHEFTGVPLHTSLHPTQIYHSMADLAIFGILWYLYPKRKFKGQIFLSYALLYAAMRFSLEFFRGDPRGTPFGGPLSTSQLVACAVFTVALIFMIRGYATLRSRET